MLYQIAYVSVALNLLDPTTLSDILEVSQRNNKRDKITGVLMHHDRLLFQVLEGERSAVERCYMRITKDPRHTGLSLMWEGSVEKRTFPSWAMEYACPKKIEQCSSSSCLSLISLTNGESTTADSDSIALQLARVVFSDFQSAL
jgi:hypothetical protein